MAFTSELWNSIFTPGITPTLVKATHASFIALEITLVLMLIATKSLHFVALLVLATGLWIAITWFIKESNKLTEEASKASLVNIDANEITERAGKEIENQGASASSSLTSTSYVSQSVGLGTTPAASGASTITSAKPRRKKRTV